MKKLIFVDNDDKKMAEKNISLSKDFLIIGCKLDKDYVDSIEIIGDLWRKTRDEIFKLFLEGDHAIVTCSVYTPNGVYDSRQQLKMILSTAGSYEITNKIYIDTSGMITKGLQNLIDFDLAKANELVKIFKAITNNYIITYDSWKPKRVVINVSDYKSSIFKLVDVDLKEILS